MSPISIAPLSKAQWYGRADEARPAALLNILTESAALTELTAKINRAVRNSLAPADLKRAFDRALVSPGAVGVEVTHGARGLVASLRPCEALRRAAEHAAAGREQAALQALIAFIQPPAPIGEGYDPARIRARIAEAIAETAATEAATARITAEIARLRGEVGGEEDDDHGASPMPAPGVPLRDVTTPP